MEYPKDIIGAAWLAEYFAVELIQSLPIVSYIAGSRKTQLDRQVQLESYTENMRPAEEPAAHLQWMLRHELVHFELLSRLFEKSGPDFIQDWINEVPTGAYSRRAAFLYEWLSGRQLDVPSRLGGNYIDVLDSKRQLAASVEKKQRNLRWRVNDNLAGTAYFCPLVVMKPALVDAMGLDVSSLLEQLRQAFGDELLQKSAVWLTLGESRSSFAIEGEGGQVSRIQRFADVIERWTGQAESPLSTEALGKLQKEILGGTSILKSFGVRQSPVFVGQTVNFQEVVHFVAPPVEDLAEMLEGLNVFLDRSQGQSAIMRAAVTAFAFVYIHPLADGNGRLHRFLVNDILRRDGVVPEPLILPISTVLVEDPAERKAYEEVLNVVSKPLMEKVRDQVSFDHQKHIVYPDGVPSNFSFTGDDVARPVWRYPNLTEHVIFIEQLIRRALTEEMEAQSKILLRFNKSSLAIKEVIEMPNHQVDRIIRSVREQRGVLSNKLAKEMPILAEGDLWERIVEAVNEVFDGE
ncbi:Fic family protein [Oligella ureolytica]|nr:Fic family protein [Oligella sp.]